MIFHYRIVNVFAQSTFGGNPLCVFEDARGLSDEQMQAIALQFNLSETVFIFPPDSAKQSSIPAITARMRIFTTGYEMPFAGHPTLGAASVVSQLMNAGSQILLECKVGFVSVSGKDDVWTFIAPTAEAIITTPSALEKSDVAAMFGLQVDDVLAEPMWVNTGTDQLLIPLRSIAAVHNALPDGALLQAWPQSSLGRKSAYLFAWDNDNQNNGSRIQITSRYFFTKQGGGVAEDPGTGSACANLGGWWIAQNRQLPMSIEVAQGAHVQRSCQLFLDVNEKQEIRVGGRVIELGRGVLNIPDNEKQYD